MSITTEAKNEVQRLLQQHRRLEAIKYLCDTFGMSLHESKILVEAAEMELSIQTSLPNTIQTSSTTISGALKNEVVSLLQLNRKIEAVKRVKTEFNTGLKEALTLVEEVDKEIRPNYRSVNIGKGSPGRVIMLFSLIFALVGLLLLAAAGIIYHFQNMTIKNSDTITGVVVDFNTKSSGTSAPVIAYERNGERKLYYSSAYTNPPAYEMDEAVEIFVNRSDPDDVVVNTFSDRWLAITIVGGLGGFFLLFGALFMFAQRKF